MHMFAGIWSQAIDMSPFTQRSQLRLFLFQVLVTRENLALGTKKGAYCSVQLRRVDDLDLRCDNEA